MGTTPMTSSQTTSPSPNSGDHLALIDYVRAVAILLVLGFHLLIESFGNLQKMEAKLSFTDCNIGHLLLSIVPFSYGFIGVSIFFLVSGFCIHLSHEKSKRKEFKVFFVRRFFRIYPPYFIALCFFAFVFPMTMLKLNSPINLAQFFSHVLLVHNLDPRSFYGINGAFWSIGVEVQLYAIYPLLLLMVRRIGWNKALFITAAIELSLRGGMLFVNMPYWLSASPFFSWFSWSIGAKLADDYLHGRPLVLAKCPLWVWPCMAAITYTNKPIFVFTFPCVALSTATVIAYFMSRPPVTVPLPRLVCNALRQIGIISYSVYLLHGPLLASLQKTIRAAFPAFTFSPFEMSQYLLLYCLVILLVSWLFHRYVELPGIEAGKWVLKRMQPTPAPALGPQSVNS